MKIKKVVEAASQLRHCIELRSVVGPLSGILLLLFVSLVLCGSAAAQLTGCPLNSRDGQISHIVYIQFDNVHHERDNPNVPADLEQLPHLYNFLKENGTFFANHHTPLISHTADDILTSLTGVYGDRHGQAVANSYVVFNPPSNPFWDSFPSSFTYWTDLVSTASDGDMNYNMITSGGQNAPAPWVPYTRAGCNVGAVSIANMEFENTSSDINNVYGSTSPEAKETSAQKVLDFEGISVHCALGNSLCANSPHAKPDLLPEEPTAYTGYLGLFGHKYVVPAISSSGTISDLFGNTIPGFPGFGGISPAETLGYVAQMLENGVPVVFSYISDAHDCHAGTPGDPASCPDGAGTYGSGEAGYVAQLQAYDQAFNLFFQRLAKDGITPQNTLFIVSADEQDHQVAGPPSPANCDGVTTPCTYTYASGPFAGQRSVGEIDVDLPALYTVEFPALVPDPTLAPNNWDFHFDMAPAMYFDGFETAAPGSPLLRQFEQATTQLTAANPITGNIDQLTRYIVDRVGLKALHMITGDPARTPNFVMFSNPDYFYEDAFSDSCSTAAQRTSPACVVVQESGFAWNHGGVAPEINRTWVAFVGPGVRANGIDDSTWTDETDIRPTILSLAGLQDDYVHDGRVLAEDLESRAVPQAVRDPLFPLLAAAYKQINAPVGAFGQGTLRVSTRALSSTDPNDATYTSLEDRLAALTTQRDSVAGQISALLDAAEFQNKPLDNFKATELFFQSQEILLEMDFLQGRGF